MNAEMQPSMIRIASAPSAAAVRRPCSIRFYTSKSFAVLFTSEAFRLDPLFALADVLFMLGAVVVAEVVDSVVGVQVQPSFIVGSNSN